MTETGPDTANPPIASVGLCFEEIREGMSADLSKTITDADVRAFAGVTGDNNPVHLDESFAAGTQFGTRIAHGMLTGSLIATLIGTKLPGPGCVYIKQSFKFSGPVRIGETVTARVTVKKLKSLASWVELETICSVGDRPVIEGEALVRVPRRGDSG